MAHLPRNFFNGFSRALGGRSNRNISLNNQWQYPQYHFTSIPIRQDPFTSIPEEWTFLTSFEQQYGLTHPFFYACEFMEALKIAQDEKKFMFVYLHSPEHPFTPSFCRETLCCESVVQFLDANFVSWGAIADKGGPQMLSTLRPAGYPFCAIVAPAPGNSIAVLQQMEGPITPNELIDILQRTLEEQGLAFGSGRAKQEEKIRADRRLREEQDAAYLAALQMDKENERLRNLALEGKVSKPETSNKVQHVRPRPSGPRIQSSKVKYANTDGDQVQQREAKTREKDAQLTRILIRFPNGERREQGFSCKDKILSIYNYIDSLSLPGLTNYKLVSSFPRRVYGIDQMGLTLKDAGLYPRASLFLDIM